MKALIFLIGAVILVFGIYLLIDAAMTPGRFSLATASAIQDTEIYTHAMFEALLGIGVVLVSLVFAVSGGSIHARSTE